MIPLFLLIKSCTKINIIQLKINRWVEPHRVEGSASWKGSLSSKGCLGGGTSPISWHNMMAGGILGGYYRRSLFFRRGLEINILITRSWGNGAKSTIFDLNPEPLHYVIYIFLVILSMVVQKCTALQYIVFIC